MPIFTPYIVPSDGDESPYIQSNVYPSRNNNHGCYQGMIQNHSMNMTVPSGYNDPVIPGHYGHEYFQPQLSPVGYAQDWPHYEAQYPPHDLPRSMFGHPLQNTVLIASVPPGSSNAPLPSWLTNPHWPQTDNYLPPHPDESESESHDPPPPYTRNDINATSALSQRTGPVIPHLLESDSDIQHGVPYTSELDSGREDFSRREDEGRWGNYHRRSDDIASGIDRQHPRVLPRPPRS